MANNENVHSIRDEQLAGIDGRTQDGQRNQEWQEDMAICRLVAMFAYQQDHPCQSCVLHMRLPDYEPLIDENDPLERGIQKVFQETPADIAKAAIDEGLKMTKPGKTLTEIKQVLTKLLLNRSASLALENVLEIVREVPTQLAMAKKIAEARWKNMKAIAKAVNQQILECQKQVERETGTRPNRNQCQCLLILRLRAELGLNYNAIGAIIGKTEDNTRQKAHRCIEQMRPYFSRCHELLEG